jgi:DNA-binding response OmpR family regulator
LKKVLVIENDADTLEMVGIILEDSVFEVVKSARRMPVEEIAKINPDLIVLDHLLGDGYGDQLCKELKNNPLTHQIPVILFSASFNIEQIANASGADAFIEKPFDITYFDEKVKELACS